MKGLDQHWDAVVVGAGVAGGCTAALLADRGWRVLLVEKSAWPRETVCGGCLSAAALNSLAKMQMRSVIADAIPTSSVVWNAGGRSFEHAIPTGAAVLRVNFDTAIVDEAVGRGARFMPECLASLMPASADHAFRSLTLRTDSQVIEVKAGVVIACDGISGTLLKHEPWADWTVSTSAFMGVAATYHCDSDENIAGRVNMSMGRNGYVGQVRIDDSTVHLAAALDIHACQQAGGPLKLIGNILNGCRHSVPPGLGVARLHGTGKLTRYRKQLGGHRVLTVGDACGYVEPVTGEGMSWALTGAIKLNQLLPSNPGDWCSDLPQKWTDHHLTAIGRQQRWCRALRTTARHPGMAAAGIFVGNAFPGLARWIARAVCEPRKDDLHDQIGHVPRSHIPQRIATHDPGNRHREPTNRTAGAVA